MHKLTDRDSNILENTGTPARQPRNAVIRLLLRLVPLQFMGRFSKASNKTKGVASGEHEDGLNFCPFPSRGEVITDEHINELRNQIGDY